MPGDGLSFAVQIRCEVDGVGIFGELFKLINDFFFAFQHLIVCFPVVLRVDTHAVNQLLIFKFSEVFGLLFVRIRFQFFGAFFRLNFA